MLSKKKDMLQIQNICRGLHTDAQLILSYILISIWKWKKLKQAWLNSFQLGCILQEISKKYTSCNFPLNFYSWWSIDHTSYCNENKKHFEWNLTLVDSLEYIMHKFSIKGFSWLNQMLQYSLPTERCKPDFLTIKECWPFKQLMISSNLYMTLTNVWSSKYQITP